MGALKGWLGFKFEKDVLAEKVLNNDKKLNL